MVQNNDSDRVNAYVTCRPTRFALGTKPGQVRAVWSATAQRGMLRMLHRIPTTVHASASVTLHDNAAAGFLSRPVDRPSARYEPERCDTDLGLWA